MSPRVSVVMPVHNAEATLAEAVESLLAQSMREFELHLILNGCTDNSTGLAERFAAEDTRVRVSELMGPPDVGRAANMGLAATTTRCVARMDADDVAHPDRLERQYRLLSEDPSLDVAGGRVRLIEAQGEGMRRYVDWVNGLATPEDVVRERFIECPAVQPALMFRREAIGKVGGYREVTWAEDHDLFLRMLEEGMRFGKVDEVVLDWRDGTARLTRTHPAYAEEQVWRMKAHFLARLPAVCTRGVAICGAGPIGKRLSKLLGEAEVRVHGFFEVNPRRIGQEIQGIPVAGPDEFGIRWREAILLGAVGVEGGRERVRALARAAGYREGEDFWCCC